MTLKLNILNHGLVKQATCPQPSTMSGETIYVLKCVKMYLLNLVIDLFIASSCDVVLHRPFDCKFSTLLSCVLSQSRKYNLPQSAAVHWLFE